MSKTSIVAKKRIFGPPQCPLLTIFGTYNTHMGNFLRARCIFYKNAILYFAFIFLMDCLIELILKSHVNFYIINKLLKVFILKKERSKSDNPLERYKLNMNFCHNHKLLTALKILPIYRCI